MMYLAPDHALPGLNDALDAVSVARALRQKAGSILPDIDVSSCRVQRFRYRRGERAVVLYEVASADNARTRQLFTGYLYRGRKAFRLADELQRGNVGGAAQAPIAYLPECDLFVQVFPYDRKLPGLRCLHDGRMLLDLPGQPEIAKRIATRDVDVERYRPGLCATLRVREAVGSEPMERADYFLKISSQEPAAAVFKNQNRLAQWMKDHRAGMTLNAPVACCERTNTVVFRSAEGLCLADILRGGQSSLDHARGLAVALNALHTARPDDFPGTRSRRHVDQLERAATQIAWSNPEAGRLASGLVERIAQAPVTLRAPTHGDLKPEHIFIGGASTTLIDNESMSLGDPAFDLGRLIARIEAQQPCDLRHPNRNRIFIQTLLASYRSIAPRAAASNIREGLAAGRLRLALHWLQGLYDGWQDGVARQVSRASDALEIESPNDAV